MTFPIHAVLAFRFQIHCQIHSPNQRLDTLTSSRRFPNISHFFKRKYVGNKRSQIDLFHQCQLQRHPVVTWAISEAPLDGDLVHRDYRDGKFDIRIAKTSLNKGTSYPQGMNCHLDTRLSTSGFIHNIKARHIRF